MQKVYWKWLLFIIASLGILKAMTPAQAAVKTPNGLSMENLFAPATFNNNSAQLLPGPVHGSETTQIIQLTNAKDQVGGVWSLPGNEFDLNQDNHISMWIKMADAVKNAGEGMAFVLHNDPRGRSAAAQDENGKGKGESLGVWGIDNDKREDDVREIAKTAIQNSWALEFDNHLNQSKKNGRGDSFDRQLKGQHIASDYPGDYHAYVQQENEHIILSDKFRYEMRHQTNVDRIYFTNGQWRHVSLDWRAETHEMTYEFDDIDVNGNPGQSHFKQVETIDTNQFASKDGKLTWGMIGTTSEVFQPQQVIFDAVPNLIKAKTTLAITNETQKKEVNTGARVRATDHLKYAYTVKYRSGLQSWSDIEADLNLPTTVDWSSAEIKYTNGKTQKLDKPTDQNVKVKLDQPLSKDNQLAVIIFRGQAQAVTAVTPITSMNNVVQTHKLKTEVTAPSYDLIPARGLEVTSAKITYRQKKGQSLTIGGQVKDTLQHTPLAVDDVKVTAYLKDQEIGHTVLKTVDGHQGDFEMKLDTRELVVGQHTLSLQAVDRDQHESEVAKVTIEVIGGELAFQTVGSSGTFAPVKLTGKTQAAIRQADWQLKIRDERGSGSRWQLKATASEFVNEKKQALRGNVYYRHQNHDQKIGSEAIIVDEHATKNDEETHDVIDCWEHEGLIMKTNAGAVSGNYTGTIKWTLADAP
ncbi:cell surface protein [Lactobacillus sp.] [Lactiplantibacillus mudanjiangensis]|uniref:lectin-like domain-containing protein n=1 Tax=Lactiplantibacillus mudanjiangensis TaxID=1296538 RepID=UPI00101567D9|nr:cell surface protein [Lactobacillus sp.] [Lactiplantibacillus mudanjiangensis]